MRRTSRILSGFIALGMAIPSAAGSEREDVPFELHKGFLIVVKGSVGNLKNLSFAVDTGSRHTVVDSGIARRLHLRRFESVQQVAPGHAVEMRHIIVDEMSWGGGKFKDWNALTSDLSSISTYVGKRIDLLLGLDVLCQDSFEIDYESRRIRFGDLPTPKNSVPFERNVPRLVVESHIDGYFVNLLVDTGSDSLAVFTDRLPKKSFPPALEQIGHDVGGPVCFTQITPLQVLVGRNEVAGQRIFLLPPRPEAQGYDGTLAPAALEAPRIYFDFKRMRFGWDEVEQPESRSLWTTVAAEK